MKFLCLVTFLVFANSSFACPNIIGTWKSSKELTMAYNEKAGVLTEQRRVLLNQILGHIIIEYTNNTSHESLKSLVPVVVNGKHADFEPFEKNYSYQVMSCAKDTLTIKSIDQTSKAEELETFTFESADTFWTSSQRMPETREYYVRTKN